MVRYHFKSKTTIRKFFSGFIAKSCVTVNKKDLVVTIFQNRGASHRIAAYKIFQSVGCDTLTMDYRGYGDSVMSGTINETTVVEDAKAAIKFIRDNVGDKAKVTMPCSHL